MQGSDVRTPLRCFALCKTAPFSSPPTVQFGNAQLMRCTNTRPFVRLTQLAKTEDGQKCLVDTPLLVRAHVADELA